MYKSYLWAVNKRGDVFRLSTDESEWKPVKTPTRMTRVACAPGLVWTVGCDHKAYVLVLPTEVPIRYTEDTYENQRWMPLFGFGSHLLPTERYGWTNQAGSVFRPREAINLPSSAWQWEAPWTVDTNGEQCHPKEGWQYGVSFSSRQFHPSPFSNAFVRRRRWVRTRRYGAINVFHRVGIPNTFPIIDIALGSCSIHCDDFSSQESMLSVWVLLNNGQVLFRYNVTRKQPEGDYWLLVNVPDEVEFNQLACSADGNVWAVTWDGRLFTRRGVRPRQPQGESWSEMTLPLGKRLVSAALGRNCAWAVSIDGNIYFLNLEGASEYSFISETTWLDMAQPMSFVAMGQCNQVFALGLASSQVFYRTSVTAKELSGRAWAPLPNRIAPPSPTPSIASAHSTNNLQTGIVERVLSQVVSERTLAILKGGVALLGWRREKEVEPDSAVVRLSSLTDAGDCASVVSDSETETMSNFDIEDITVHGTEGEVDCPVSSGSVEGGCVWTCVAAGQIDGIPNAWLHDNTTHVSLDAARWRAPIVRQLVICQARIHESFHNYQSAIDRSGYLYQGFAKAYIPSQKRWGEIRLQLIGEPGENRFWIYVRNDTTQPNLLFHCANVRCLAPTLDSTGSYILSVHSREKQKLSMNQIAFDSIEEQRLWLDRLQVAALDSLNLHSGIHSTLCNAELCAITADGQLFVGRRFDTADESFNNLIWLPLCGHFTRASLGANGVAWALGADGGLWACGTDTEDLAESAEAGLTDTVAESIYEHQRWSTLYGYCALPFHVAAQSFPWSSDENAQVSRSKESVKLPSTDWRWANQWSVDQTYQECDSEGWIYARTFAGPFGTDNRTMKHARVRRRRWRRTRCYKVNTTNWRSVRSSPLRQVVLSRRQPHFGFALLRSGELLCRHSISAECPAGTHWSHVQSDNALLCVDKTVNHALWAIETSCSVLVRYATDPNDLPVVSWTRPNPCGLPAQSCPTSIACGTHTVALLDSSGCLYRRDGITRSCPEGSAWSVLVQQDVQSVSVSSDDVLYLKLKSNSATLDYKYVQTRVTQMSNGQLNWEAGLTDQFESIACL